MKINSLPQALNTGEDSPIQLYDYTIHSNLRRGKISLTSNAISFLQQGTKEAVQSITNYGAAGYGGPCPPEGHGFHQYIITVHALKVDKLGLDENTNPAIVGYYLWNNTIAQASMVAYYQR